jgi:large subunit ribosomal protein L29
MQATEVRELNDRELEERIAELQEERFRLRLRAATQPLEQPHRLRELRKDIARMKTVLHERRMGLNTAQGSEAAKGSKDAKKTTAPGASKAKRTTARRGR